MSARRTLLIATAVVGCGRFGFNPAGTDDGGVLLHDTIAIDSPDSSPLIDGTLVDSSPAIDSSLMIDAAQMVDDAITIVDGVAAIDGAVEIDAAVPLDAMVAMEDAVDAPTTMCATTPMTCQNADLGTAVGAPVYTGTTTGQGDDFSGGCGGAGNPDIALAWTAPVAGRYVIDTRGSSFDTLLSVRTTCTSGELTCNDDDPVGGHTSAVTLDLAACESLVLVVDSPTTIGSVTVNTRLKCPNEDLGTAVGLIATGSTTGLGDSYASGCASGHEPDVAYQWRAPSTGRYEIDTRGSSFDTVLSVRPTCTDAETLCNDDDPVGGFTSAVAMDLTAGQPLVLVVDSRTTSGTYMLNANRKCPGAELGSALGLISTGSTTGKGDSYEGGCGGHGNPDVELTWTAPTTGRYMFDTRGSVFNTLLSIRPSCSGAEIACNDDDPVGGFTSAVSLDLDAGTKLVLVVDSTTTSGTYALNANRKCPGQDLGGALGLIATGSTTGKGDSYSSSCASGHEPDVTYAWRAPATGRYMFDTRGSSFDTALSVRSSCTGAETACNDDDPVGGFTSAIALDLVANQELTLVVDSASTSGSYMLSANAKCPGADLGSAMGTAVATGTTTGAGDGFSSSCGAGHEPDVAFTWTAPSTGKFKFDTKGSSFDTLLSIRPSCSGAELVCNDDDPAGGFTSAATLDMTIGQQIVIVIDSTTTSGSYKLDINPA